MGKVSASCVGDSFQLDENQHKDHRMKQVHEERIVVLSTSCGEIRFNLVFLTRSRVCSEGDAGKLAWSKAALLA